MFCNHCGTRIDPDQQFCQSCGAAVAGSSEAGAAKRWSTGAPARSVVANLERHVRILGAMWLVYSGLRLIEGLGALFVGSMVLGGFARHFHHGLPFRPDFAPHSGPPFFVPALVSSIGGLLLIAAIAGLAAGFGLLHHRPWARPLALILGAVSMLAVPFGTALGIYTFWALLPTRAEQEYRAMAGA